MCDNLHSSGRKNGKFIRIIAYGNEIYEYIQAKKKDEKRMARKGCPRNAVCVLLGRLRRLRLHFFMGEEKKHVCEKMSLLFVLTKKAAGYNLYGTLLITSCQCINLFCRT